MFDWFLPVNYCVLGGFIVLWMALFYKLFQIQVDEERVPFLISFSIVSMGMIATALSVVFNWGDCVDILG